MIVYIFFTGIPCRVTSVDKYREQTQRGQNITSSLLILCINGAGRENTLFVSQTHCLYQERSMPYHGFYETSPSFAPFFL